MKFFIDKVIFFIYASTSIEKIDRKGVNNTMFLILFLEILLFLPVFIFISRKLDPSIVSTYLKLPNLFRYGILSIVFVMSFGLNYLMLGGGNYILHISEKLDHKRKKYYSYRWLLAVGLMLVAGVVLLLLRVIKMM